jgi:hypothetical protein
VPDVPGVSAPVQPGATQLSAVGRDGTKPALPS